MSVDCIRTSARWLHAVCPGLHWNAIVGYCLRYSYSISWADDAIRQDMIGEAIVAALKAHELKPGHRGYIAQAAQNAVIDFMRKTGRIRNKEWSVPTLTELHNLADWDFEDRLVDALAAEQIGERVMRDGDRAIVRAVCDGATVGSKNPKRTRLFRFRDRARRAAGDAF